MAQNLVPRSASLMSNQPRTPVSDNARSWKMGGDRLHSDLLVGPDILVDKNERVVGYNASINHHVHIYHGQRCRESHRGDNSDSCWLMRQLENLRTKMLALQNIDYEA